MASEVLSLCRHPRSARAPVAARTLYRVTKRGCKPIGLYDFRDFTHGLRVWRKLSAEPPSFGQVFGPCRFGAARGSESWLFASARAEGRTVARHEFGHQPDHQNRQPDIERIA